MEKIKEKLGLEKNGNERKGIPPMSHPGEDRKRSVFGLVRGGEKQKSRNGGVPPRR